MSSALLNVSLKICTCHTSNEHVKKSRKYPSFKVYVTRDKNIILIFCKNYVLLPNTLLVNIHLKRLG